MALARALTFAVAAMASVSGATVVAQESNPCALLTMDEVQALAPKEDIGTGVANMTQALESFACHYTWSVGARRYTLAVSVNPASRVFVGMSADSIKQGLVSSVVAETADSTIAEIGQTAVFRAYSPAYVGASAYVKDRILQVNLEGVDAREKKEQVISLLKAAASRL